MFHGLIVMCTKVTVVVSSHIIMCIVTLQQEGVLTTGYVVVKSLDVVVVKRY
jgi:hypothetical protein